MDQFIPSDVVLVSPKQEEDTFEKEPSYFKTPDTRSETAHLDQEPSQLSVEWADLVSMVWIAVVLVFVVLGMTKPCQMEPTTQVKLAVVAGATIAIFMLWPVVEPSLNWRRRDYVKQEKEKEKKDEEDDKIWW